MARNPNVIFFPASDLGPVELFRIAETFEYLTVPTRRELRAHNPLLQLGKRALESFTKDPKFFGSRTIDEIGVTIQGFQTYQDFSALVQPPPPEWAIKKSIDDLVLFRKTNRYSQALQILTRSYREALPYTSRYLEKNLDLAHHFTQGASIAHNLELGARCLAILGGQGPTGRDNT